MCVCGCLLVCLFVCVRPLANTCIPAHTHMQTHLYTQTSFQAMAYGGKLLVYGQLAKENISFPSGLMVVKLLTIQVRWGGFPFGLRVFYLPRIVFGRFSSQLEVILWFPCKPWFWFYSLPPPPVASICRPSLLIFTTEMLRAVSQAL